MHLISVSDLKEQNKKRIVVILLLISCFITGYIFFSASESQFQQLKSLAQADSLIQKELSDFSIAKKQIKVVTTKVDSNLTRKTFYVNVAQAFAKTQLHAALNRAFYNYSIKTPAVVTFPKKDVMIHLLFNNTVIRTVNLRADSNLVLNYKPASVLVAFDSPPGAEQINNLASMGEMIPIVLKIENPLQANGFNKQLANSYPHILFWLQNEDGKSLIDANPRMAFERLSQLQNILPSAMMLQFSSSDVVKKLANINLTFIDAANAIIIGEEMGKALFWEVLDGLKTSQPHPLILIKGSETTLNWLKEKLPELKKAGVRLTPPSPMNL